AGTNLTIAGTNLDLVLSVKLGGGKVIEAANFVSRTATQIVLAVPADTKDGKVILVPASGVEVSTATDLVMVVPTVSVTPVTLKNGQDITVTGTNLDLVDHVIFGGDKQGTIKAGGTATQILVTVPDDAVDGVVTFVTKADKEIAGPNLTMIVPAFSSFSPTSARANSTVTLSGTDLDLVTKVIFTGGLEGSIGTRTGTSLAVTVPVGAKTGKITIVTKNGTQVVSAIDFTLLANLPTFGSYTETRGEPGKILTINGTNMLLVKELIFPGEKKATAYGSKSDTRIEVYVPEDVTFGTGTIRLVTYEGEEGFFPELYFGGTDPVLNQTFCFFDFNGTGKDSWWGNAIGSGILNDPASSADGTPYWNINGMGGSGWWDGLFFRNGSNNFVTTGVDVNTWAVRFDINVREAITEGDLRIRLGSYFYHFQPWNGVAGGFKTTGWITVTCPLTGFKTDDGTASIPDAALGGSEFGMIWSHGVSVKVNMGIDNVRFEPIN
ncbi:MAG TPA: glycan-binding surface protein, partial [Bacteroidales bacterium]|nr:glycan-binding surface protein [Bacteroidales bacterium]